MRVIFTFFSWKCRAFSRQKNSWNHIQYPNKQHARWLHFFFFTWLQNPKFLTAHCYLTPCLMDFIAARNLKNLHTTSNPLSFNQCFHNFAIFSFFSKMGIWTSKIGKLLRICKKKKKKIHQFLVRKFVELVTLFLTSIDWRFYHKKFEAGTASVQKLLLHHMNYFSAAFIICTRVHCF